MHAENKTEMFNSVQYGETMLADCLDRGLKDPLQDPLAGARNASECIKNWSSRAYRSPESIFERENRWKSEKECLGKPLEEKIWEGWYGRL